MNDDRGGDQKKNRDSEKNFAIRFCLFLVDVKVTKSFLLFSSLQILLKVSLAFV